ncbi:hypothetical protein [Olleya sp. Bg11-27]|uniref:hypothetical protein n=1 Tax=Olleya sp. Bg11-27 TaxID=2058135 RepID=UPI000C3170E3|nr:hypothetical protein [Olleya sp. Bg11-27]AUC75514.1 hypothetical protein CW732_07420 [Olleya sp. Bg11-27]
MQFKRLFFDSSISPKSVSKGRFISALIIGLISAVIIYTFFYGLREFYRVLSVQNYMPIILSEDKRSFYNLFFAGLSMIFGQSIMLSILISRPQKVFSRRNNKRQRILNDQVFLNFNVAFWIFEMGLFFADFLTFIDLFYPLILLIIVMYLDVWKVLLQVIGKKRYKYLFIHFVVFCLLTFGLSKINNINYQTVDAFSLKSYTNINLPRSNYKTVNRGYVDDYDLNYVLINNPDGTLSVKNYENKVVNINEIRSELVDQKKGMREVMIPRLAVNIFADSTTNLVKLKAFEERLFAIQQGIVNYVVFNEDDYSRRFEKKYVYNRLNPDVEAFKNTNSTFYKELPPFLFNPISLSGIDISDYYKNILKVNLNGNGVFIDGYKVFNDLLIRILKNNIAEDILIEYVISEESTYQDYIWVLSSHKKVVEELRQQHQTIKLEYDDKYRCLNKKAFEAERDSLRELYPFIKREVLKN